MTKRGNLKRLFLFNGLLLLIVFILIQYSVVTHEDNGDEKTAIGHLPTPKVTGILAERFTAYDQLQEMPDFSFQTRFNKAQTFDDLKGQWVVLNFWATWCPPCLKEMPSLQGLQDSFGGQGVKVVAVSLDRGMTGGKLSVILDHFQFGPVAAHYGDGQDAMRLFDIKGLPITYILEPGGRAIGYVSGDIDWTSPEVNEFIKSLIGGKD